MLTEEVKIVNDSIIIERIVAEVQDTLHFPLSTILFHLKILYDPLQVLQLQVGDAYMTDDAFRLELEEGGQGLVDNELQSAWTGSLKLNIVYID